ncbi:MAG: hypothetical protein IKX30_15680 [Victivallales bacterium]|nr:hypothetical protein [Victivallales bacterium]
MDRKYILPWQVANFSADFIKFHKILTGGASNVVDVLEILEILEILKIPTLPESPEQTRASR